MIWISHISYWSYNWPQRIIADRFGSCPPPEEQSGSVASLSRDPAEQSVHVWGRQREHTVSVHKEHPLLCISEQVEHFFLVLSGQTEWKVQKRKRAKVFDPLGFKLQICHLKKTKTSQMNQNDCVNSNASVLIRLQIPTETSDILSWLTKKDGVKVLI